MILYILRRASCFRFLQNVLLVLIDSMTTVLKHGSKLPEVEYFVGYTVLPANIVSQIPRAS